MPACLRVGSRVEPMNLSGPGWRYHSPARGLIAGSMMSSGVALPFEPTRLYQTTILCARASSCSRFRFGIAATQRGRAVQPPFIISRNRSAVVEGSTVTSFSSGGGGATAVFQSEMTSAADGDPRNATRNAPLAAAAKRDGVMLSSLYLDDRRNRDSAYENPIQRPPHATPNHRTNDMTAVTRPRSGRSEVRSICVTRRRNVNVTTSTRTSDVI